jgi:uncharacterized membrane-anchored protein YhcB (DUF1043 family)
MITVDNQSNCINILLSGGKSGVTLDNDGIKLCTKGKVEISAGDTVDIKSSSNIFLHEGAPSCSSSNIQNPNLKSVISNIYYFPSTNLNISPSVLISALDEILQNNKQNDKTPTSNTEQTIDKHFNKLISKLENINNKLVRLFEDASNSSAKLDEELDVKLGEKYLVDALYEFYEKIESKSDQQVTKTYLGILKDKVESI